MHRFAFPFFSAVLLPNMMKLKIYLLFSFIALMNRVDAQVDSIAVVESGSLELRYASSIEALLERYKKVNYSNPGVEGFRVQIFSAAGNEAKEKANKALADFQLSFPEVPAQLTYQQPNFKVRCGNYRHKSEARKLQKRIAYQYPGSFIVKDFLKSEELP